MLVCRDKSISGCYHVVVRYGYIDRVDHSQAFMEQLVQQLLKQVLERKGVGSPGAAQRLLAALAAKATPVAFRVNAGAGASFISPAVLAAPNLVGCRRGSVRTSATGSTCGGALSIAEVLAASRARAASAAAVSSTGEGIACTTSTGVIKLLKDATAAELAAILALPQRPSWEARAGRHSSSVPGSTKHFMTTSTASTCAFTAAEAVMAASASDEVLARISLRVDGEAAVTTDKASAMHTVNAAAFGVDSAITIMRAAVGEQPSGPATCDASSLLAAVGQRASAQLLQPNEGDESVVAAVNDAAISSTEHCSLEERQRASSCSVEDEDFRPPARLPSYWGALSCAGGGEDDGEEEWEGQGTEYDFSCQHGAGSAPAVTLLAATSATSEPVLASLLSAKAGGQAGRDGSVGLMDLGCAAIATSAKCATDLVAEVAHCCVAEPAVSLSQAQLAAVHEAAQLLQAYQHRWVHCVGRTTLNVLPGGQIHKVVLGGLYRFLATNSRQLTSAWCIPTKNLIELGMDVECE